MSEADVSEQMARRAFHNEQASVYRARLSQTGTDDPVATVFQNSIGSIVWTRDQTGTYYGELEDAFPLDRTFVDNNGLFVFTMHPAGDNKLVRINHDDADRVSIVSSDGASEAPEDGLLIWYPVEILVFPA